MSYREIRSFIEMLSALGYPRSVSLEAFRRPNFALMADVLVWLTKRFDPDLELTTAGIETEEGRIRLVRNVAQFMVFKANVKLNTKKLYQSDGFAVKELLKIASVLHEALNYEIGKESETRTDNGKEGDDDDDDSYAADDGHEFSAKSFDVTDRLGELKLTRQLASEIASTGAKLYDLIGEEVELRQARQVSVNCSVEIPDVEEHLKKTVDQTNQGINEYKQLIENVSATEAALDTKIERRKVEIERYEKRLATLKKVRPAFLEEFTALETELENLFVQYSERVRLLNHLERMFGEEERTMYEKNLAQAPPHFEPIPLDELDVVDDIGGAEGAIGTNRQDRPRASTGRSRTAKSAAKVIQGGNAQPPIAASPSLSSGSESDEMFLDKEETELLHSDDDDDEDESLINELDADVKHRTQTAKSFKSVSKAPIISNSDDEF